MNRYLALFFATIFAASSAHAGTLYIDTGGAATNSCSRDSNSAALSGTGDAVVTGSTVQLTLGVDLSGVNATAGSATQDTIYIAQATNSNTKIFWITGKDDTLDQVTVSVAPTGVTTSNWAIGGRCVLTNASQEAALRAGDTLIFNNAPATQSATMWTFRNAGDSTSGYATIKGKAGVRPLLNATSTNAAVSTNNLGGIWIENMELDEDGATNQALNIGSGVNVVVYNIKISDAGSSGGITVAGGPVKILNSEITGSAGDGIQTSAGVTYIFGNYIHDNVGDGIEATSVTPGIVVAYNVIDTNAARGIFLSGAATTQNTNVYVTNNTIYANGNSGLEVTDADISVFMTDNIFVSNGDAVNEYNVEYAAGSIEAVGFHAYNDFFQGGGSAGNLFGVTLNSQVAASEITTDPALSNPASGNFTITSTSAASATGYPGQLLGASGQGFLSMGAQVPTPGAGVSGAHSLIIGGP